MPASRPISGGRISRLHLVALSVLLATLLISGGYWERLLNTQAELREQNVGQLAQRAQQLTESVAGQTATLVHLVDFAVQHLRDDYREGDRQAFAATVETVLKVFPANAVLQIGVIDADGYLAYSNLGMRERVFLGDREHFKVHAAATTDQLFISKPVLGRVSRTWSIQFTRPILSKGHFAGVVVLSLAPEYISTTLAIPGLDEEDVIALLDRDGSYLSRNRDLSNAMGKSVPAERPFVGVQAPVRGTFRVAAMFDKIHRTYAWRRLDAYPLVVSVGIGETPILVPLDAAMRQERQRNAIGIGIVLLLATGIAALLISASNRQQALAESENRYRSFFETNTAVKLLIDPADGRIVDANRAAVDYYGHPRKTLLSMRIGDINCLPPEQIKAEMARAQSEQRLYFVFPHRLASGEVRQVEVYSGPVELAGRRLLFSVIHDITARIELEHRLKESEELYRTLFEAASEGILVTDAQNRIVAINPAFTSITGFPAADVLGKTPSILASGQHDAAFYQSMWQRLIADGRWEGEIINRRKDGSSFVEWLRVSVIAESQGRPRRFVGLFSDVTEKKQKEERVWRQANYDPLTGLPNRQLLEDRLERAIAQAHRRDAQIALLFIDLDRFKPVNDTCGHAVGDELLRQVGRRLQNMLREEDTVARLGGDEFIAVLPDLRTADVSDRTAEKTVATLSEPFRVGEHILEISCSVGVALFPRDADNAADLIKRADAAMYAAKAAGRATWTRA